MTNIDAKARNVRELLGGKKYTIDYFQREYRWRQKEIGELITDLTARFLSAWKPIHERSEVANYPAYFLGSIIVSGEGGKSSVIDGQQRLTSLSILLIWVLHGLTEEEDRKQLSDLIFTRQFGSNAYNLDVPERVAAMESLYRQQVFNRDSAPESVRNILDRYDDIGEQMPAEITLDARALFADWLIERVYLVEIKTPSDDDGYAIFETMNDRGLPLSPTDMLKSHLLANAGTDDVRKRLNGLWKGRIDQLLQLDKEADADAIKNWLRARHAETIRERQAGASAQDFERIGTEFHRWIRESGKKIGLSGTTSFVSFVDRDFAFYTSWYLRLQNVAAGCVTGREAIYCNNLANFTLQFPLMLAPLSTTDSEELAWRKISVVATFVDILIARRLWQGRSIDYNTMQYAMFLVMKEIRGKSPVEIAKYLRVKIAEDTEAFSGGTSFGLGQANKKVVRRFLARLTAWLDNQFGLGGHFGSYFVSSGPQGFDIEHIIADQYERHAAEFASQEEFQEARNRIGALLLLPKSFNRSYGALPYEEKRPHYLQQSALAQTLHEQTYLHNPRLSKLIVERGMPFTPHAHFEKSDIAARQEVYARLADAVWSVDRLETEASGLRE
jgi:hypothetical protein